VTEQDSQEVGEGGAKAQRNQGEAKKRLAKVEEYKK
jgi:hypothetical protein